MTTRIRLRSGWNIVVACCIASELFGCSPDLGKCDDAAAHTLVYDLQGVPYYAGQALVHETCAGGAFCHSASATGAARYNAPGHLNFDVQVVDGDADAAAQMALSQQLKSGLSTIVNQASDMFGTIDDGEMPPGGAGNRPRIMWLASDGNGGAVQSDANTLPDIRSSEGTDVVRNWLACNAPVVAGTTGADAALEATGDLLPKAGNGATVEANWTSIYDHVIEPKCVTCHNANISTAYPTSQLNLARDSNDGNTTAYDALINQPAFSGGPCKDWGALVVPNDCDNSLLLQKLQWGAAGATPECGLAMPYAQAALDEPIRQAVCDWIMAGATAD